MNGTVSKTEICKLIRACNEAAVFWFSQWKAHRKPEAATNSAMFSGQLLGLYSALNANCNPGNRIPEDVEEIMKLNVQRWEEVYSPQRAIS